MYRRLKFFIITYNILFFIFYFFYTITTVIHILYVLIIGNTILIHFIIGQIYNIVILFLITFLQLTLHLLTYTILSKKNVNGFILTIHKYGFSAYQQLYNLLSLMSSHGNIKRLFRSNVSTHITKIQKNNIMSIRHSSILLNTYIIHTHSYQGFIIIININIIIYHWYRLRYYFIYLI